MEYLSAKGMFTDRLGQYDEAALRFGYVNQVQVFKKADIQGGFTPNSRNPSTNFSNVNIMPPEFQRFDLYLH